jgi:DNA-binding XRE family transcriptional regulator
MNTSEVIKNIKKNLHEVEHLIETMVEHQDGAVIPIDEMGRLIKDLRNQQGLTLKELAMLAGVSLQTLVNIEKGEKNVSLSRVEATLKILGKGLYIK